VSVVRACLKNPGPLTNAPDVQSGELAATQAQLFEYASDLRRAVALGRARSRELEQAYVDAVSVLASAVEARDPYTGGHAARPAAYAVALARVLGWSETQIEDARLGGLLHDLGKLAVDDAILRKPGAPRRSRVGADATTP
jgi:HD-GYP domain-containing protein (c-di-GMP phosphodiesterase class II)